MSKKEGRQLVSEAVKDAQLLKEMAFEAAKNQVVEQLAPGIKALLDRQIRGVLAEDSDRLRRGVEDNWPGESHTNFEEGKEQGDKPMADNYEDQLESLAAFFPGLSEMDGEEDGLGMDGMKPEGAGADVAVAGLGGGIPTLGEAEDAEKEGEMDEDIEISEAELRRVYEQALQTEVQVKKGFSDFTGGGELDQAAKDTGILDKKNGETNWEKEEPPAAEDWIPENVQKLVRQGLAENKALRKMVSERNALIKHLGRQLQEVNLFNAKVLHVNRLLNSHGKLTKEQKKIAIESLDKARSVEEVRNIYETVDRTFKATQLAESNNARKPVANAQRARTSGTPNEEVLRESVDRGSETNSRWMRLAGLVK